MAGEVTQSSSKARVTPGTVPLSCCDGVGALKTGYSIATGLWKDRTRFKGGIRSCLIYTPVCTFEIICWLLGWEAPWTASSVFLGGGAGLEECVHHLQEVVLVWCVRRNKAVSGNLETYPQRETMGVKPAPWSGEEEISPHLFRLRSAPWGSVPVAPSSELWEGRREAGSHPALSKWLMRFIVLRSMKGFLDFDSHCPVVATNGRCAPVHGALTDDVHGDWE